VALNEGYSSDVRSFRRRVQTREMKRRVAGQSRVPEQVVPVHELSLLETYRRRRCVRALLPIAEGEKAESGDAEALCLCLRSKLQ